MPEKSRPLPTSQVVLAPKSLWSRNFRERRKKLFPHSCWLTEFGWHDTLLWHRQRGARSTKHKRGSSTCNFFIVGNPKVALPVSTECGRTFTVNHLCAYQQMGVRNRWKRRHGHKDKVKNKVNCCRAAASYEGLLHFQGHKEIQVGGLFVLYNVHSTSRKWHCSYHYFTSTYILIKPRNMDAL